MNRLFGSLPVLFLLLGVACSPTMGEPRHLSLPTVALLAGADVPAAAAGAAVREGSPRIALVFGPADTAWYDAVAAAAGLQAVSGPGMVGPDLGVAFLGMEAVGDTTLEITYDGGRFTLHDALYDLGQRRFLDLLAFRVETPAAVRPVILALTRYIATDVEPGAAVVMAVAVPSPEVGDSVARMLTPMYRGAPLCGAPAAAVAASGVRLFFGPDARIYCRAASAAATAGGERIRAELVVGRRR
jgi:hypothetical protein